jgi:hypothetical protein
MNSLLNLYLPHEIALDIQDLLECLQRRGMLSSMTDVTSALGDAGLESLQISLSQFSELIWDAMQPKSVADSKNLIVDSDENNTIVISELAEVKEIQDFLPGCCRLCERVMPLTAHHVFPKTTHKKLKKRGADPNSLAKTMPLCRPCHSAIHSFITEWDMAMEFHTLEALLSHPKVQTWVPYAKKQRTTSELSNNKLRYRR